MLLPHKVSTRYDKNTFGEKHPQFCFKSLGKYRLLKGSDAFAPTYPDASFNARAMME